MKARTLAGTFTFRSPCIAVILLTAGLVTACHCKCLLRSLLVLSKRKMVQIFKCVLTHPQSALLFAGQIVFSKVNIKYGQRIATIHNLTLHDKATENTTTLFMHVPPVSANRTPSQQQDTSLTSDIYHSSNLLKSFGLSDLFSHVLHCTIYFITLFLWTVSVKYCDKTDWQTYELRKNSNKLNNSFVETTGIVIPKIPETNRIKYKMHQSILQL